MSDERIATLEAHRVSDQVSVQHISKQLDRVAEDVMAIKLGLEKQKGFLAGCMCILLPIWSAFTIAAASLWDKLTGQ